MTQATQQYAFKAEIQQLLHILIHSLYTDREIFLRELVSNASDALHRVQFETLTNPDLSDSGIDLAIDISVDEAAGTLTISDSGIGMSREDLIENLGVIAHSGARDAIERIKSAQSAGGAEAAQALIGQFGVGFYSVFMVADKVRVITRSAYADARGWAWESTGDESFTLEEAERETRGTDIILHLKEDAKDFLQDWTLREIVRRHSNYIAFPIFIGDDETPTNKQTAIWRQEAREVTEEQYNDFYRMHTMDFENPLHRIHMRADSPFQFYALMFIPANGERPMLSRRTEPGLSLYARKVLIDEYQTDLLPDYLNFVQGVVDSEDLPLNVSRESVQANRVMAALKRSLTNKVLSELKKLADKDTDAFRKVFTSFGRMIKQGVVVAPEDRDQITPLLRFASTRSADADEWVSLAEYVARKAEGQTQIYYVLGDDYASAARSPHLDAFRKRGIEVLYLTDPVDTYMLVGLNEFDGQPLRAADDADLDLSAVGAAPDESSESPQAEPVTAADFTTLSERVAQVLGGRITEVRESKVLVESPARLVSPGSAPQRNLYRINRMLDRAVELPVKILELNPRHRLIRNLTGLLNQNSADPLIDTVIEQLFETALLQEGLHPDPASMAARMVELMQAATRSGSTE
ncbi:MAG: molecular chaperone HtpG [Chloroflexota bacterium]|nr:molecular chaperone HtpG [Chloroflexota bacterium]